MSTNAPRDPAAFWNERFAADGFAYGTEPNDFVRECAPSLPAAGRVACIAEGEGRNAVFLAMHGHDVLAIDISDVGLAKAARLAADRGVNIRTEKADLAQWTPASGSLDAVVSIWAHLPPPVREPLHRRIVDALRPGGVLLLEAYTPAQVALGTGGPRDAALMMTAEALRHELVGLEIVHLAERERDVHEGPWHNGRSAVVQLLARKPEPGASDRLP